MEVWQWLSIALWLFVVAQGVLLYGLLRQIGVLHRRIDALQKQHAQPSERGLSVGEPAPTWMLPCIDGAALSSRELRGKATLIAFVHPACGPCKKLLPQLDALGRRLDPTYAQVVIISLADGQDTVAMAQTHPVTSTLAYDETGEVGDAHHADYTPFLVVLDADGIVRSGRATSSLAQAEGMLTKHADRCDRNASRAPAVTIGDV